MRESVVDLIFQPRTALLEVFRFLVGGEIDLFFNAIDRLVQGVVFLIESPELIAACSEAFDRVAMFRELPQDRMMEVHRLLGV